MNYSCFLISNDYHSFKEIKESIYPETLYFFNGKGFNSFSQLVNQCIATAPTETVIIMSDKVRPKSIHVKKTLHLLEHGHAFVGLYRFGFFGLKKQLLRKIGMFDERYVGGGFEDYDFVIRLIESNLSMFVTEEVPYKPGPSKWANEKGEYPGYSHWCTKWFHHWEEGNQIPVKLTRLMQEEKYDYDLGPEVPTDFLSCKQNSFIHENKLHVSPFFYMEIS